MKRVRKIVAAALVLCLVFSFAGVSASGNGIVYKSGTSGFSAQKISHPDAGSGEVDGIIEYSSGVNDRGQNYSWSAAGYGDYMYVGTCYAAIYSTIRIMARQTGMSAQVFQATLNALYNGTLYLGDLENNPTDENRSIIVRINIRTGETKIVTGPHTFGGFRSAIVFNNKLYFCSTAPSPYLLEIDPANDDATQIVYTCQRPSDPSISLGIRGLAVVNGKLAASMIGDDGAYIVASSNPSAGQSSFDVIGTQDDLLDYPAYRYVDSIFGGSIWDMMGFNGKLYITVVTGKSGNKQAFALFCGEEDEASGKWTYRLIAGDKADGAKYPYGLGADRSGAANLIVHDGYLYIGGYNDPMIALPNVLQMDFEELYKDLSSPVCLWRMDADENFELVAGEPNELFPEVKGNFGAGLGSNLNQYVWRMESYNGKLFVGTFDIGSLAYPVMQLTNGDIFKRTPEEWQSQIRYIRELMALLEQENASASVLAESVAAKDGLATLSATMGGMTSLLDEGGISDLDSSEAFYKLLETAVGLYERIRDYLPDSIRDRLDELLNQESADNFFYFIGVCKYLSQGERGFDLLVSDDGLNFDVITRNGFGDPNNHGCRVFAITDQGLCIGTANPFYGTQIWKIFETPVENDDTPTVDDETDAEPGDGTGTDGSDPQDGQASNDTTGGSGSNPDTGAAGGIAAVVSAVTAGAALVLTSRRKKRFDAE